MNARHCIRPGIGMIDTCLIQPVDHRADILDGKRLMAADRRVGGGIVVSEQFKEAVKKLDRSKKRVHRIRLPLKEVAVELGVSPMTLTRHGVRKNNLLSVCKYYVSRGCK